MALRTCVHLCILATAAADYVVWPPPQRVASEGPPLALAADFRISTSLLGLAEADGEAPARLARIAARYQAHLEALAPAALRAAPAADSLRELQLVVLGSETRLHDDTDYSYELQIDGATGTATAASVYGAAYALESFLQLLGNDGRLQSSYAFISDAPAYRWRGLMLDAGRRFFPMDVVRNLLDTMAANKLNVLHLHASDHCRWAIESKLYPQLTGSLTGQLAGHYTQQDIKDMIAYAADRGIRVVPEFDVPGHAHGLIPLESEGLKFCTTAGSRSQLYGDPDNSTYTVLTKLFTEMAGLFTDDVFNIGGDETTATGPCSVASTFALERRLFNFIKNDLKRRPEGWQEVLFNAAAATNDTIVNSWTGTNAPKIVVTGRDAVESASPHFYFTYAVPGGPAGWKTAWYDIGQGVPADKRSHMLGGEMSMWSDTYCYILQCGAFHGAPPVGHALFDPSHDAEFGKSVGGMIWPRGYVGAGAFWNYDASVDPTSDDFVAAIWKLNTQLIARGAMACPTNCTCDQLTACGKPYLSGAEEAGALHVAV